LKKHLTPVGDTLIDLKEKKCLELSKIIKSLLLFRLMPWYLKYHEKLKIGIKQLQISVFYPFQKLTPINLPTIQQIK